RGLILAWECGCKEVICETDYLDAYLLITQDQNLSNSDLSDLLYKIHDVLKWNWSVIVTLIQRTANSAADHMARRATSLQHYYSEWLLL
ncbi:hypothetical protein PIB30_090114, partial [Stylosanthes scabra]|nr:hypothetical protein [Stylosanthes scabra]